MARMNDPLAQLFPADFVEESIPTLAGGAAAGFAYHLAVTRLTMKKDGVETFIFDKPWKRVLLGVGLGFAGGRVLWDRQRDAAKGVLGAMGSNIGVELLEWAMTAMEKKDEAEDGAQSYLRALHGGDMNMLAESTIVSEEERVGGRTLADAIVVEEEPASMAGWLGS